MTAGTRRPRNPPSARTEAAASAATLAYNVAISQVTSGIGYVMANDGAAVLSVIAARTCGVSRDGLGLCPDRLGTGIRIGLTTAWPAAAVVGLGAVVPATRGFFHDERARGGGTRHVLFETFVRIPLGTALPEEVIFRGSLLGLFMQRHSPAVAASMSSILFGVWHVLPTLRTLPLNPAGARVQGSPMRTAVAVLATVTATTAGSTQMPLTSVPPLVAGEQSRVIGRDWASAGVAAARPTSRVPASRVPAARTAATVFLIIASSGHGVAVRSRR